MLKTEILRTLSTSDRWGTNDQPDKRVLAGRLQHLPIDELRMPNEATLYMTLYRPLKDREWIIIGYLNADSPNWDEMYPQQMEFVFWWD